MADGGEEEKEKRGRDEEEQPGGNSPGGGQNRIEVKVLFFARAREISGVPETSVELREGELAVSHCLGKVIAEFPGLEEMKQCMVLALNHEYAPLTAILKDGDELAIIPPISGG